MWPLAVPPWQQEGAGCLRAQGLPRWCMGDCRGRQQVPGHPRGCEGWAGVSGHHGGNWELRWGWDKQVSLRSMGLAGSVLVGAVGQGCSQPGRAKRRQLPAARGTVRPELRAGGHQGLWLPEGRDQELGVTAGPQDSAWTHTAWAPIVRHTAGVRRAEVEPGGGVSSKPGQDRVQ